MHNHSTVRRVTAGASALLLAGGIAWATAGPAMASDDAPNTIEVVTSVADHEAPDTYNSWHEGYNTVSGPVNWTLYSGAIEMKGKSQLIKGITGHPLSVDQVIATIEGPDGIGWGADSPVNTQLVFGKLDASGAIVDGKFTTLYPDDNTQQFVDISQTWHSTRTIVGSTLFSSPHGAASLSAILTELGSNGYSLIAYGMQTNPTDWSTVFRFQFGSQLTVFGTPMDQSAAGFADSDALAAAIANDEIGHVTTQELGLPATVDPGKPFTVTFPLTGGEVSDVKLFDVWIYSTPTAVGTFASDGNGDLTVTLSSEQLSALPAGEHTLLIRERAGDRVFAVTLTIAAATDPATGATTNQVTAAAVGGESLAATGFDSALPLTGAVGLILLGALGVFVRRRTANGR